MLQTKTQNSSSKNAKPRIYFPKIYKPQNYSSLTYKTHHYFSKINKTQNFYRENIEARKYCDA